MSVDTNDWSIFTSTGYDQDQLFKKSERQMIQNNNLQKLLKNYTEQLAKFKLEEQFVMCAKQIIQNNNLQNNADEMVHMEGQFERYANFANKLILYNNLQTFFRNKNLRHLHIMILHQTKF